MGGEELYGGARASQFHTNYKNILIWKIRDLRNDDGKLVVGVGRCPSTMNHRLKNKIQNCRMIITKNQNKKKHTHTAISIRNIKLH